MNYKNKKEKLNRAWICLFRKFIDWEWYQNGNVTRVFLHCLLKANWQDKCWQGQEIKRGQFVSSYRKIAAELNLSIQQVRTALNKLRLTHEITLKSTSVYSIITVNNYDFYQDNNTRFNSQLTGEQQTNNKRITTTNNENNENNISTTTLLKEKEFLENNKDFHWRGEYQNVGLTDKQIYSLEVYIGSSKKLKEYIDSLSENIEEKKEEKFDFEFPNMHEIRIKKYFKAERKNRKVEKTEKPKTKQIKRELTVEEQIKRDMELIGHDYE